MTWLTRLIWEEVGAFDRPATKPLEGASVAILGGGPSLSPQVANALQVARRLILVNNSYLLSPKPGLVVAMDRRWWTWHGDQVRAGGHTGVIALRPGTTTKPYPNLRRMQKDPDSLLTDKPEYLTGRNSGHAAIQLAVHLGASRIFLAGFDMGFEGERSHWHAGHVIPSSPGNYAHRFRPALEALVNLAKERSIDIAAITPTYADIPTVELDHALKELRLEDRMDYSEAPASL